MSRRRRDSQYLVDIRDAIFRILDYTHGLEYKAFLDRPIVQDAVIRNLQVIGEATKKLSDDLRLKHPDVPWRDMAGLRDRLVHDYFGIDYPIVWDVVQRDLPSVLPQVETILQNEIGK